MNHSRRCWVRARRLRRRYTVALSHRFGIGGLMSGASFGIGVTGRGWWHNHLGVQVAASRSSVTAPILPNQIVASEFSPSVLYSLPDAVTDYVWVQPYAGGGLNVRRQRVGSTTTGDLVSENAVRLAGLRRRGVHVRGRPSRRGELRRRLAVAQPVCRHRARRRRLHPLRSLVQSGRDGWRGQISIF